jgi:virginiamycin B lyase
MSPASPATGLERAERVRVSFSICARLALAMTAVALVLALPATAGAYLYWPNSDGGSIGRANEDGTGIEENFIHGLSISPSGVAADAGHIYWASEGVNGPISRSKFDGSGFEESFISAIGSEGTTPNDVAVDATYVYWTEQSGSESTARVSRAKLDGSEVERAFIETADYTTGLAVDSGHIYWTMPNSNYIGRAAIDGSKPDQEFIKANHPEGVAVDAGHVYWTNATTGTIGRATLEGKTTEQEFIEGLGTPIGIAVSGEYIFWSNIKENKIGRAKLNKTEANLSFITAAAEPRWLTIGPAPSDTGPGGSGEPGGSGNPGGSGEPPAGSSGAPAAPNGGATTTGSSGAIIVPGSNEAVEPPVTLKLLAETVLPSGSSVAFKLRSAQKCTGTLTGQAVAARAASTAKGKPKSISLGTAGFALKAGQVKTVVLKLSKASHALLALEHTLKVQIAITLTSPGYRTTVVDRAFTLKMPATRPPGGKRA